MKKLMLVLAALAFMLSSVNVIAQQKKFKFAKVSRDVKKEAKRYEKDGYKVLPGKLPIGQQLNDSYTKQTETDDEGFPKYLVSSGSSVAQTQAAAEMQAIELAKQRLVGLIETQMKSVIETEIANNQLDATDAASLTKSVEVSSNKVSKKLGRVMILFEVFRPIEKNTEIQVLVAYNYELAKKAMIDELKVELEVQSEDMRKKYDRFLNPDAYKTGEVKNSTEQ